MKTVTIFAAATLAVALGLGVSAASAQGFSAILEKLDRLEARLNGLETVQKQDIQKLKTQLSSTPRPAPAPDMSGIKTSMTDLRAEMDRLAAELAQMKETAAQTGDAETVSALAMDLRELTGQIRDIINRGPDAGTTVPLPEVAVSEKEASVSIEISGFGDVYRTIGGENTNEIGQMEVDLGTTIDDRITVEAAIAYGEGAFALGAFTVDFHLFGSEGDHFHPTSGIDHSGVILGQFDVPFGIDWHVYPSVDRKLVSAPLAVEHTHKGWNDQGVQGYLESRWLNAVAYVTNGFGYGGVDGAGHDEEVEMKVAVGGRLGVVPHEALEIGGSYAGLFDQGHKLDMALFGADVQLTYHGLSLKGEYIVHKTGLAGDHTVTNRGFYGQGTYDFGRAFVVGRYGRFLADGADALSRLSLGGGLRVVEGCELRVEHQRNTGEEDDMTFLQTVVGF